MELYAIRYGVDFKYATYNSIFRGNNSTDIAPGFIFLYYIAKYKDKTLMFDTGFRCKKTAEDCGINLYDVADEIKTVINVSKVDTIFITHSHFDHTDNLDLYPDSEIIISQAEYDAALAQYDDSIGAVLKSDRVHIVQDEYLYEDKFLFKIIGGHTEGSSVVYFNENHKQYVIAGDECYFIENVLKNIPNGRVYDPVKNENFIKDIHNSGIITLPSHDNRIFDGYPVVAGNIARII